MEALILLGVLGAGYLIEEDKNKKHSVYNEVTPPLVEGSGNTIYDINNFKDAKKYEIDKALPHQSIGYFERSFKPSKHYFFSGDHTTHSSIEGAMLSGKRIADRLIN